LSHSTAVILAVNAKLAINRLGW